MCLPLFSIMSEGGSLSSIVRDYFRYVAKDDSKPPQERVLSIMGAAVKFTGHASKTGDEETLNYLLSEGYIRDFVLPLQKPDVVKVELTSDSEATSAPAECLEGAVATTPEFFAKYNIDPDKLCRITDALELLFPGGRNGELGKKLFKNAYCSFTNSIDGKLQDLLTEVKNGKKTFRFVRGRNIPLLWQRLLSRDVSWKKQLPEQLISDVMSYGAKYLVSGKETTQEVVMDESMFLLKYGIVGEMQYSLNKALELLFPDGQSFSSLYQKILVDKRTANLDKSMSDFIFDETKGKKNLHMIIGKNFPAFLRKVIEHYGKQYLPWKDDPPKGFTSIAELLQLSSDKDASLGVVVKKEALPSEVSSLPLLKQLDDLMYCDEELSDLLKSARSSNRVDDVQGAISWSSTALSYLEHLKGRSDEVKRLLRLANTRSVLALYYKDFNNDRALENVNESIKLLNSLDNDVLNNPAVRYLLAKQYFTRGNINYRLNLNQSKDVGEATRILWLLFQEKKLVCASEFELLHYCLRNVSLNEDANWHIRFEMAGKRKEVYSYMIDKQIRSEVFDPAQELIMIDTFLSGRNMMLYRNLDELVLDDPKVENFIIQGMAAKRNSDKQGYLDNFKGAIEYLLGIEGEVDEVKRQLKIGLIYEELGMFCKEDGVLQEAIKFKELAVRSLEFVVSRIPDSLELQKEIANDCLSIANMKYKLKQDDTSELKKAHKYLWPLFEKEIITDSEDYISLARVLYFLSKRSEGEERVAILNQRLQFYAHAKSKNITIPYVNNIDVEILFVKRKLAELTSS